MTLHFFRHVLDIGREAEKAKGRWRGPSTCGFNWVVPRRDGRMYCPVCLAGDKTTHFRLAWRLRFAPICVKHKVLLESDCGHCHHLMNHFDDNAHYDIGKCPQCESSLSSALPKALDSNEDGYVAISNLLGLLYSTVGLQEIGWEESKADLFASLKLVVLMLLATAKSPVPAYRRTFRDASMIYGLMGRAWRMLLDSADIQQFIANHRGLFHYLTRKRYPYVCPKYFNRYTMIIATPS